MKHQRVKIEYGTDGSATDVSATNPLPVTIGTAQSVSVAQLPAADYTTDSITSFDDPRYVALGGTQVTVQSAAINATSAGNNTIIGAPGTTLCNHVLSFTLIANDGPVTATFQDGAGGASLFGPVNLAGAGFGVKDDDPHLVFKTSNDTLLNLSLSGGTQVGGRITYIVY